MVGSPQTPTKAQFTAYEAMFGHFNQSLFAGELPACLLNFSRKAKTYGFYAPDRWRRRQKKDIRPEISLNPASLTRKPIEVASTLVHEMVHHWQHEFGNPSRPGYHNAEWAAKMEQVGLTPSSTGEVGGARVGQHMSHCIAPGGPFEEAFKVMPSTCLLPWSSDEPERSMGKATVNKNKVKYTCPGCEANVWGKPDLNVVCGDCDERYDYAA